MTKIGEATSPPRAGKARARIWRSSSRPRSLSAGLVKGASTLAPAGMSVLAPAGASVLAPVASAPYVEETSGEGETAVLILLASLTRTGRAN